LGGKSPLFSGFDDFTRSHASGSEISRHRFDGWSLDERDPQVIKVLMAVWEFLYHYYFRVKTDGWHHLPSNGGVLIVGSHNGGLLAPDMFMFMYDWFRRYGCDRPAYGLMHPAVWKVSHAIAKGITAGLFPLPLEVEVSTLAVQCGAIVAHPKMARAALQRGAAVLVYPGGAEDAFRAHRLRHQIYFAGRKGFIKLALQEGVPIVPAISKGAHDTVIILDNYYKQVRQLHEWGLPWLFDIDPVAFPIYLGLPWGLGIGPIPHIPLPVQIHTRVCKPIVFERYGFAAARDRKYVDACYNQVLTQMQLELDRLVQDCS
jgi:1-acyl-sn-glycerol-3-phosphate acyltransferase